MEQNVDDPPSCASGDPAQEKVSEDGGPAFGDASIFEHDYRRVISTQVDASLCKCCRMLAVEILAGPAASSNGWQTMAGKQSYFSLSYLKEHQDGKIGGLLQSAKDGCELCTLMAQEIRKLYDDPDPNQVYHIFVWLRVPVKCEFLLGLGSISRFSEDIGSWGFQPIPFLFFRRNGSDSNWSNLDQQVNFADGVWPALPAWPNQSPASDEAFHRAKHWLSECTHRHRSCSRSTSLLPKRVLDLGTSGSLGAVTLYITKGEVAPYVTLSYSWGSSLPLKTTSSNIDEHCAGISLETFPKTLREAIFITRNLNFRYLWIDALCIIQGNEVDWAEHAAAMTEIYQGSILTISATCSADCDSGVFTKLPDYGFKIGTYIHPDDSNGEGDIFVGIPNTVLDLGAKYLSSRGWVSQERLVSVASLHYTDEGMVWECAAGIFLEHNQGYRQFGWKSAWRSLLESRRFGQVNERNESGEIYAWKDQYDFWNRWISEYSAKNLTHIEDKLPAVAGIAKFFASKLKLTYVAGLWKENLVPGLLWQRHHGTKALTRYLQYVAPSWSWASVKGLLKYRNIKISASSSGTNLMIVDIEVGEDQLGTFGRVSQGKIVAEGLLQEVVIDERKTLGLEYDIIDGVNSNAKFICTPDEYIESADMPYKCWCLNVGTFNSEGRQSRVFLLLKKMSPHEDRFGRIGRAEIDAWKNKPDNSPENGFFVSGRWSRFTLV